MTPAEFLVLTLLAEEPRSGYDLERAVDERRLRNWTPLGASSVYFLLDSLAKRGLAVARERPGKRGPARKVCELTGRGRAALAGAVDEALSTVRGPSPEPDFAFMNFSRVRGFDRRLAAYEQAVAGRLAETRLAPRPQGDYARVAGLIFTRHIYFLRAELNWVRAARRILKRRIR
jgi:DNA-binding PadR family transcriptional regulator